MFSIRRIAFAAALVTHALTAQADLIDRGGGMIYDTELNITWLQDWNYAKTSNYGFGSPAWHPMGKMNWNTATVWARDLEYGGFSDWRLPTMVDTGTPGCNISDTGGTDCGYNSLTKIGNTVYSELAHLYYVTLGNVAICAPVGPPGNCQVFNPVYGMLNTGPFINIDNSPLFAYWTGLSYATDSARAWFFNTRNGGQYHGFAHDEFYAVAVRDGDVAAAVPEPGSVALMLLGLCGMAAWVKKRPRN